MIQPKRHPLDDFEDGEFEDPDYGTCPYFQSVYLARLLPQGVKPVCQSGCIEEPVCVTNEPLEGWPSSQGRRGAMT